MVSTKREIRGGSFSSVSATRSAVGSVAFERGGRERHHASPPASLAEEGDRRLLPPSELEQRRDRPRTSGCRARAAPRRHRRRAGPAGPSRTAPTRLNMKQTIAIGASWMTSADQLHRDLEQALDRVLAAARRAGVCTSTRPMPKNSAKNITARMSLSLAAATMLLGTMREHGVDARPGSRPARDDRCAPSPPCGEQLARQRRIDAVARAGAG